MGSAPEVLVGRLVMTSMMLAEPNMLTMTFWDLISLAMHVLWGDLPSNDQHTTVRHLC